MRVRFPFPPPITKIPTLIGWDFFCPKHQCLRGFRPQPLEHAPPEVVVSGSLPALFLSLFSVGLLSIQGSGACDGAGLWAIGLLLRLHWWARPRQQQVGSEPAPGKKSNKGSSHSSPLADVNEPGPSARPDRDYQQQPRREAKPQGQDPAAALARENCKVTESEAMVLDSRLESAEDSNAHDNDNGNNIDNTNDYNEESMLVMRAILQIQQDTALLNAHLLRVTCTNAESDRRAALQQADRVLERYTGSNDITLIREPYAELRNVLQHIHRYSADLIVRPPQQGNGGAADTSFIGERQSQAHR